MTHLETLKSLLKDTDTFFQEKVRLEATARRHAISGPGFTEAHDDDGVRYPEGKDLIVTPRAIKRIWPAKDQNINDVIFRFDLQGRLVGLEGDHYRSDEGQDYYEAQEKREQEEYNSRMDEQLRYYGGS